MKLKDIYSKAVKKGIKDDPRPRETVHNEIKDRKAQYRTLKGGEKKFFDKDSLENPYYDSRILYGDGDLDIKNILVGIDIDVQELLLADRLRDKGHPIDLVVSHHPSGRAFAQLDKVMGVQPGIWESFGFPGDLAKNVMKGRMDEVERGISSRNHNRAADAAKLLDIPLMCLHTAADNCVTTYLQKIFDVKKPKKVSKIVSILKTIPEYSDYYKRTGIPPKVLVGDDSSDAGRIFVDMTGGTNGPDNVFGRLSQTGVGTVVGMHLKESGFKTAKAEFVNYVIAGHIASDNLGMNLLFDAVDPNGKLNFIECSGFKRIRRTK